MREWSLKRKNNLKKCLQAMLMLSLALLFGLMAGNVATIHAEESIVQEEIDDTTQAMNTDGQTESDSSFVLILLAGIVLLAIVVVVIVSVVAASTAAAVGAEEVE